MSYYGYHVEATYNDEPVDAYAEHCDFNYASDEDWDNAEAHAKGADSPDTAWILTSRDVWHANPFYTGPETIHPEAAQDYDI